MTLLNPATIASWLVIGGSAFAALGAGLTPSRATNAASADTLAAAYILSIALGSALWFGSVAAALHFSRRWVTGAAMRWVSVACGLILLGFAGWFVWEAAALALTLL